MDVPLLLAAVSATSPCGEDLEYDADFLRLERDSRGQPERSMGDSILPAEPPEWRSIQQQSLDLLQRSKDLRITHFLLQSSLALEGLPGMARVLTLISELLKQYCPSRFPDNCTSPALGRSICASTFNNVVLPHPFAPINAVKRPSGISRLTPLRICCSP